MTLLKSLYNFEQAIDTGTTLIGGPSAVVSAFYAKIPGSQMGAGSLQGYYTFRMFFLSVSSHKTRSTRLQRSV